jgi:hypothetical protein
MNKKCVSLCVELLFAFSLSAFAVAETQEMTETIIVVRHGEKPPKGLGQLKCRGLNRALALPDVLISKFGQPNYIFAPNPSVQIHDGNSPLYSYVRPLATIEPTAIKLGMNVNTQIGYNQIQQLQTELTNSKYATSLVFVAWEHGYQYEFAKALVKTYGGDPSIVPDWRNDDYDMIFVIHLKQTSGKTSLSFNVDHEGLNNKLSDECPAK